MRVALVHDDLVQWGGAERVLLGLSEIYPDAPIFTSVIDWSNENLNSKFVKKKIVTSFLQKIPAWKTLYKSLLPFYPLAFELFDFSEFDLVISNTTRFAKSIITKPHTRHVCFCHTPPRFLWHFSSVGNFGIAEVLLTKLRLYDQISANRVDYFIAGSENAKKRIKKIYRQDSKVVYPFVELDRFKNIEVFDGGYFVALGRAAKYKRFDLVKQVCDKLGKEVKIIEGSLSDEQVVEIMAGCTALIIAAEEDFGISSLEAQALGKPVIAYGKGGVLETVKDGQTGVFFDQQTADSLERVIDKFSRIRINPDKCKQNAQRFRKENFIANFKQTMATLIY